MSPQALDIAVIIASGLRATSRKNWNGNLALRPGGKPFPECAGRLNFGIRMAALSVNPPISLSVIGPGLTVGVFLMLTFVARKLTNPRLYSNESTSCHLFDVIHPHCRLLSLKRT